MSADDTAVSADTWSRSRLAEETEASRTLRTANLVLAGVRDAAQVAEVIYGSIFHRITVHVAGLESDLQWVAAVEAIWTAGVVVVLNDVTPADGFTGRRPTVAEVRAADLLVLTGALEADADVLAMAAQCGVPAVPLRALVAS